jgi:negative regulator of flagellin synthesis FlgM
VPAKVSGVTSSQSAAAAQGGAGQRPAATDTRQSSTPASETDSVEITDTASHLVTAEQGLAEVPVVNPGRIAQVRSALASGTYRVSSERIASKLLQYDRLLPQYPAE